MMKTAELGLAQEWDKTFPKSEKVEHSKVTFINRYGITLAADMYVPKDAEIHRQQRAVHHPRRGSHRPLRRRRKGCDPV